MRHMSMRHNYVTMKFIILLLLCHRISFAHAAAPFYQPNFKSWFWPSSIVVDDWLYLHGGELHYVDNDAGVATLVPNNQTFAIDLTKQWSTYSVPAITSDRDAAFKPSRRPETFYDPSHKMVYSYGGQYYGKNYSVTDTLWEANVKPEVWGFTPNKDGTVVWKLQYAKSLSDSFPLNSSLEVALAASSDKKHYSFGGTFTFGVSDDGTLPYQKVMENLVSYDYATQKFTNFTDTTPPQPHAFAGEAQFVPHYGKEGVLLFFGGKSPKDRGVATNAMASFSSILVYDISSESFHTQAATGLPGGRYQFCSVGASNAQNSSYEIFIYGGNTDNDDSDSIATLSSVYILTLPAFQWLQVPTPAETWRNNHNCQKVGQSTISQYNQRQFLSIGGIDSPQHTSWVSYTDEWTSAMKIFDLTALTWSDSYDPDAKAYTRPDIVEQVYSGGTKFPPVWGDDALKAMFNNSAAVTTPEPTSTPTPDKGSAGKTIVGPIAGGVVGGVAVAVLVGVLLWWFCWRKRRSNNNSGEDAAPDYGGYRDYENVKQVGHEPAQVEGGELPAGNVRGELPVGDDTPRRELAANEYRPYGRDKTEEPQELPTVER